MSKTKSRIRKISRQRKKIRQLRGTVAAQAHKIDYLEGVRAALDAAGAYVGIHDTPDVETSSTVPPEERTAAPSTWARIVAFFNRPIKPKGPTNE